MDEEGGTHSEDPLVKRSLSLLVLAAAVAGPTPAQGTSDAAPTYPSRNSYQTWTRQAFTVRCSKSTPQVCRLERQFDELFPEGLIVGDPDGPDGDDSFALLLRTSSDVRVVIVNGGPHRTLGSDTFGAASGRLGELIGNLLAAKVSLAFATTPAGGSPALADLEFGRNVHPALRGWSAAQVVTLADHVVAGDFGQDLRGTAPKRAFIDVDGDTTPDLSMADVSRALYQFTASFDRSASAKVALAVPGPGGPSGGPVYPTSFNRPEDGDEVDEDAEAGADVAIGEEEDGDRNADADVEPDVVVDPEGPKGPCACTYSQDDWAGRCTGGNAACLRDELFSYHLPGGIVLGDPNGPDGDARFALVFRTSQDVAAFLPQSGRAGTLDKDAESPRTSAGGELAGRLLAAKLNVALAESGIGACGSYPLDSLTFFESVAPPLRGRSVAEVIRLADAALSGRHGDLSQMPWRRTVDVDADGDGDISAADLAAALERFNASFAGCASESSILRAPKPTKSDGGRTVSEPADRTAPDPEPAPGESESAPETAGDGAVEPEVTEEGTEPVVPGATGAETEIERASAEGPGTLATEPVPSPGGAGHVPPARGQGGAPPAHGRHGTQPGHGPDQGQRRKNAAARARREAARRDAQAERASERADEPGSTDSSEDAETSGEDTDHDGTEAGDSDDDSEDGSEESDESRGQGNGQGQGQGKGRGRGRGNG